MLAGQSLPTPTRDTSPYYACMDFLDHWLDAMDKALGARGVYDVPDAEWIALASKAEVEALAALPVTRMARC